MKPSRNDPCPRGSGKKYKKCCLDNPDREVSKSLRPGIPIDAEFQPAALRVKGEGYAPAIACIDAMDGSCRQILARSSRPFCDLDAAIEAHDDIRSADSADTGRSRFARASYFETIGYKVIEGAGLDDVELLEDLESEEEGVDPVGEMLLEAAESQIAREDPPEARQALVRLRRAGYSRDRPYR